jgi:hypothetical protein
MPKPVFITCAEQMIESKERNLLTLVDIIEMFDVQVTDSPQADTRVNASGGMPVILVPWQPFKAIAVWKTLSDDDPEATYEVEWQIILPSGEAKTQPVGNVKPNSTTARPLWRVIAVFMTPLPLHTAGELRIINRLRPQGGEWLTQEYQIMVNVKNHTETSTPP